MQHEPKKTKGNYNEFISAISSTSIYDTNNGESQTENEHTAEQRQIIEAGVRLVDSKVEEILGSNNRLTRGDLDTPKVKFITASSEHTDWAGYFSPAWNEIGIITDNISDNPLSQTKVFIHEYLHFLSHNGCDDGERVTQNSPIARNNNVGFRRSFGLDIRDMREGQVTSDYFLAFNEAVTEQLAIDILPAAYETYADYRGLLNQVIVDAMAQDFGSNDESGQFVPWTKTQIKNYIYQCYFRGDIDCFSRLLQAIYEKYDISEQQYGLMTHKDDLPSLVDRRWSNGHPDDPPPLSGRIVMLVQERLDLKIAKEYVTDIIEPEPRGDGDGGDGYSKYGQEYDTFISEGAIAYSHTEPINGVDRDIDNLGYIIYRGVEALSILESIKVELNDLLRKFNRSKNETVVITERMDQLLFETYRMSMLSDGFRDFYVYKHAKLDSF